MDHNTIYDHKDYSIMQCHQNNAYRPQHIMTLVSRSVTKREYIYIGVNTLYDHKTHIYCIMQCHDNGLT